MAKAVAEAAAFSVVPGSRNEVVSLTSDAINAFWQMRRYGESWESAQPDNDYYGSDAKVKTTCFTLLFQNIRSLMRPLGFSLCNVIHYTDMVSYMVTQF